MEFDGQSMVSVLSGVDDGFRQYNFGEYHPTAMPELYNQTVSTHQWRLTLYPFRSHWGELFDLESDPGEHFNLFDEAGHEKVIGELSDVLACRFPAQPVVDNEAMCKW